MSCHRHQSTPLAIGGRVTGVPDMGAQVSTTGAVADIGDRDPAIEMHAIYLEPITA